MPPKKAASKAANDISGKKFYISPDVDEKKSDALTSTIVNSGGKIMKTTRGAIDFIIASDSKDEIIRDAQTTVIFPGWVDAQADGKDASSFVHTPPAAAKAATKPTRGKKAAVMKDASESEDDTPVAPVKRGRPTRGAAAKAAVVSESESESESEDEGAKKPVKKQAVVKKAPAPKAPAPRGKKAVVASKSSSEEEEEDEEEEKKDDKKDKKDDPANKKVQLTATDIGKTDHANKGIIPTDTYVPSSHNWRVISTGTGNGFFCYDFMLNQANISQNNNKFYLVQVLQNITNPNSYAAFFRWGRINEPGQNQFHLFSSREAAISAADKKVKDKCTHSISTIILNRNVPTKPGKYTYLQRVADILEKEEEEEEATNGTGVNAKTKLHPRLASLVEMISDIDMINRQLVDFGFDPKQSPLGKLSKDVLLRGLGVLGDLETEINKGKNSSTTRINELSSLFYTLVPHGSGRAALPAIKKTEQVQNKAALVESLLDIEASQDVLFLKPKNQEEENIIDQKYKALKCELKYLPPTNPMHQLIQNYAKATTGSTHSWAKGVTISDIFEVHREDEVTRQEKFQKAHPHHNWNKQLLWHGSRVQNFTGILSTGLRLPAQLVNVPITGAMFDSGIYSADSFSKSYNYCTTNANNEGCIMLLEVMLGGVEPMYNACYTASKLLRPENHSILGLGRERPEEVGCQFVRWNTETGEHEIISRLELEKMKHYYHHETTTEKDTGNQVHPHSLFTSDKKHAPHVVKVPMGQLSPCADKYSYLQYNEYIVFTLEQVRIKYICRFQKPAGNARWW